MPSGGQDRRAAQTGAPDSLQDGTVDATAMMKALPRPVGEQLAKAEADVYFGKNPDALSYVRAYRHGEVHPLLALAHGGMPPEAVAVAVVHPGLYARVMIHPGMLHATARIWAEQAAREERVKLGLKARP